jgi:hypothetical protein
VVTVSQGQRARHELRRGDAQRVAAQVRRDARRIAKAYAAYVAKGEALAAVEECDSVWPSSVRDVAPTVCQKLKGHAPGEEDGGHRHRLLGSQVVVTW